MSGQCHPTLPSSSPRLRGYRSDVLPFDSVLTPSGDGVTSHRLRAQSHKIVPTLDTSQKSRLSPVLLTGYKREVSSLSSINLLEQLMGLRKIIYLLDEGFIGKEFNSGTDSGRDA